MSQTYQIALDPTLNISADEFAADWNAADETRQTGQLVSVTSTPEAFHSPDTAVLFLNTAESHYKQALQIKIEFNDRYGQASNYGQLGLLAQAQENWLEAANYLLQALEIFVQVDDQHYTAQTIRNLTNVWQANQDNTIPNRLAEILGITPAEAQTLLKKPSG